MPSCFSFCTLVDRGSSTVPSCWQSNPAVESAIINSNNVPKAAFFAVFVRRNTCLYRKTQLRLYCVPTCKRCELNDYEEKLKSILIGDGSSDKPMCSNEKAYVFLSEGIVTPLIPGRFQRIYVRWGGNLFSNKKYYTSLECNLFSCNRPCTFFLLSCYHVMGQFVIGQSVICICNIYVIRRLLSVIAE